MIEEYLKVIGPRIEGKEVPCIFKLDTFFDPVEWMLLETKRFERGMPQEYGNHSSERKGYRWLKNPIQGTYKDDPITLARTTLHLKSNGNFLEALVFNYDKDAESIGSTSSVYLLENGFIVSTHDLLKENHSAVVCWNPGTESTPASVPYPVSFIEIYYDLRNTLDQMPISENLIEELKKSEPCRVAGILTMLCVEAAKEVQKNNI